MKEYDDVVVKMSDGAQYAGRVFLMGKSRVRDVFNDEEVFVVLKDVTTEDGTRKPFMVLNKHHVVTIAPGGTGGDERHEASFHHG